MVDKMGFPLSGATSSSSSQSLYFPIKPTVRDIRNFLGDAVGDTLTQIDNEQLENSKDIEELKSILKEVKSKASTIGRTSERKKEEVVNLHTRQQYFMDEAEALQKPIDSFILECKTLEATYMRCSGAFGGNMKTSHLQVPNQERALYINELEKRKELAYRHLEEISETVQSLQMQPPPSGQLHCLNQILSFQQWTFERLHKKTGTLHDQTERLKARVPYIDRMVDAHTTRR